MTTKTISNTISLVEPASRHAPYPDAPQRDDMQNSIYLYEIGTTATLRRHFGNPDSTLVRNEARLGPSLSLPKDTRVPDLMVAFDCHVARVQEDNGYSLERQPHPPEFVLEVASRTTGFVDYTEKRVDYARYGVGEYWRFDPTRGEYHDDALAGDRLVGGVYEPIAIAWTDAEHGSGYSDALGLYVCWEREVLRFYDPVQRRYLRTMDESEDRGDAEAARADAESHARQREADARRQAEAQAAAEAELRRQADDARRQADARAAELEARLAELQRREDGGA